jgi:hypothetical protein
MPSTTFQRPRFLFGRWDEETTYSADIHKLIDEQLEVLKGKLTQEQVIEYIARKRKIGRLLEEISRDGLGA